MQIDITPVAHLLEAIGAQTRGLEYSGFGYVEKKGSTIVITDIILLNVGSETYTEISPAKIAELARDPKNKSLKCWFH